MSSGGEYKNFWTLGRELEQDMFSFLHKGMNGTPQEREDYLKQIFHGVRFNGRVAILAAPLLGKSKSEVYDALLATTAPFATTQAKETGYDEKQTALYVEAHLKAYESLTEEFGLNATDSADPPVFCGEPCGNSNCSGQCRRPSGHSADHFCSVCHRSW
jgi:hypothetical protein